MKSPSCSLDTNAILALILDDRTREAELIEAIVESRNCYVEDIVFAEIEYVLTKTYSYTRELVAYSLESILAEENIYCRKKLLQAALEEYLRRPALSFVDIWLAQCAQENGRKPLYTFDRKLAAQLEAAEVPN